ncbi:MAG: hypothetical protein KH452_09785 [Clostridiales bacterium]|nr:hypothetical protein [Clostridiales bacterium]
MAFWKEHVKLRSFLILGFFLLGLALVIIGWKMTGQLAGLGLMMVGTAFLLVALSIYNKPFETPKKDRRR